MLRYSFTCIAYLPVLAINTGQITTAEKDIADSILPAYGRLFSPMNTNGTDIEFCIAPADSFLPT
jgi:hypothetical protein